jgi:ABC-2 type transport system ATP-binding protein
MEPVIVVDGLTKRYGNVTVVDHISFEVGRGEIFGIPGRNGAGRTTTIECLQGLRRADGGQMRVLGLDPLPEAAQLRRRTGSQLQESALPQRIKLWEALHWFASFVPGACDPGQLIEQWGLREKRNTPFFRSVWWPASAPVYRAGAGQRPGTGLPGRNDHRP